MIIGIDGNEANVDKQVGVSVYTSNLLKYFQEMATADTRFKIFLRNKPSSKLPPETPYFKYQVVKGKILWSQWFLPLYLNTHKDIDVFFSPAHYSPRFCPVPLVVTIHDLSYFSFPNEFLKKDLYKLQNWTKHSVEKAKKIITVSKTTKKDVIKYYQVPEGKIEVVYNGFEKTITSNHSESIFSTYPIQPQQYILYVGTLQPRKNIPLLIKSFQRFRSLYPDHKLVITGKKGWLYKEIFTEVENLNLVDSVIFTDYVPDEVVTDLYKNAFCFVLPSLYEGFGLPVLEAMSFGCPVITSHSSSLPEIGGDACLYFDVNDENDLLEDLKLLKNDDNVRQELIIKGKERVKLFSWKKCAEETLQILKNTQ